ncbi:MAG: aryl-sulfate sulfotransferase [Ignavibacteria bacterium]|nr:aryl-sulfate sulfotransferase [Ignavibacteria bacterium]
MKYFCSALIFLLFVSALKSQVYNQNFDYLDPLPNSKYINEEASIIIRPKTNININTIIQSGAIRLLANNVSELPFNYKIADSGKVILLKPLMNFKTFDSIYVYFTDSIKTTNGESITPFNYKFYITGNSTNKGLFSKYERNFYNDEYNFIKHNSQITSGVPQLTVTYSSFPSPGKLFFNNLTRMPDPNNTPCLLIADNDGNFVFSRQMPEECYDFNIQPNGMLTYFDGQKNKYYALNSSYNIIDSFYCGNGYTTDLHELRILNNGHFLLLSYDARALIDIGGENPMNATVIGVIVQELDENKDVIFQFRSWDHFLITDATHENFSAAKIDYCHSNAIEFDNDGYLLLSSRNMDEITKINRVTGKIIWRMGGKNNQFTFINDTIGFSHQHAIRRIKNGNVTLFDNGNFHNPPFSRAVEYKLDEVNKTATLVWQFRNSPDIYAPATGYVQRLDNNNTIICWGLTNPTLAEVRYDGTKVLEMSLPQGVFSYRAFKYPWKENPNSEILPQNFSLLQNYPNPFNPVTNIKFTVPKLEQEISTVNVTIKIYDITGKLVKNLLNDNFSAGTYTVKFDGANLPSNVYFYVLKSGNYTETKKMVMVK